MLHRIYSGRACMESNRSTWVYVYRLPMGFRFFQRSWIFKRPAFRMHQRQQGEGKERTLYSCCSKEKPFLADPKFLKYKGFEVGDEADNGIQLWYLPFEKGTEKPVFKECARHPHIDESGYVLYYTNQCPFNAKYVPVLEETAKNNGIPFRAVKIESRNDAQNAPTPITTYSLFCDGKYVTNEQMNDKKFLKLVNG